MEQYISQFKQHYQNVYAANTIRNYVSTLRQMLNKRVVITRQNIKEVKTIINLAQAIDIPIVCDIPEKIQKKNSNIKYIVEKLLTANQLAVILEGCFKLQVRNKPCPYQKDIWLAILLGYYAGFRISEVVNLQPEDIKIDKNIALHIQQGKGSKFRITYLKKGFPVDLKKFKGFKFTEHLLGVKIKNISKITGIPFTFHSLRHTYATNLLAEGISLPKVSKLLGHADVKTTLIYLHAVDGVDEDMKRAGY